jgi:hypothetical protein
MDTSAADGRVGLDDDVQAAFGTAFVIAVSCLVVAIVLTVLRDRAPLRRTAGR